MVAREMPENIQFVPNCKLPQFQEVKSMMTRFFLLLLPMQILTYWSHDNAVAKHCFDLNSYEKL